MTIAYDRAGDGPPLVLVHPLGADRHVWDPMTAALAATHDVVALDLPGFGSSPPLTGVTPTPRALATAIAAMLRAHEIERPHVAGISLGGWVALELGLSAVAGRVTAIAPAGLWARPLAPKRSVTHRLARAFKPLIGPIAATRRGRRLLLSGSVAHPDRVPARDAIHLVRAYGRAPAFVAVNDAMRAGTFSALERIPCPVTLVWPDHDRLVRRPEAVPPHVRSVVLSDAGHVPTWDRPGELVRLIVAAGRDAGEPVGAARDEV
ncbi:MAG TPA: alpha/beta fold hydrolase [Solirubrobacteraceae bacterium]|nr:alpha/beta fold hydrolase [Solirubrobacteraceae bacterium]